MSKLARTIALAVSLVTSAGHAALSQSMGATKVVVPFPAGGAADTLARLLVDQIVRTQDATLIVDNRPGANGVIGTEAAAHAAPNGSTVLLVPNAFLVNPQLRRVNYDALADFEPICNLARTPIVLAVNGASPYRKLSDLIDAARAKPGGVTLASSVGGVLQIGWFTEALQAPEIKSKLVGLDYDPVGLCGAEFRTLVRKQYDDYGRVIREAHIKAE